MCESSASLNQGDLPSQALGKRLATIVDLVREGVLVVSPVGKILQFNPAARLLFVNSESAALPAAFQDLTSVADWQSITTADFGNAPSNGVDFELAIQLDTGAERIIKATVTPEYDEQDTLAAYIIICTDITSMKAAETELSQHKVRETLAMPDHYSELTELLNRYRRLFETMGEGIVGVEHPDVPRFALANPAAERLFGVGPGKLVGRKLTDFCPAMDHATLDEQLEKRKTGRISTYELNLIRPDGEQRIIQVTGSPLLSAAGEFLGSFSLLLDITDQKQHEKEITRHRNLLAHAHRLVKLGTWEWDIATGGVEWSDETYNIFGLERATYQPHIDTILLLYPEHTRGIAQELVKRAMDRHEAGEYEQEFYRADGSHRIFYSTFEGEYDRQGKLVKIIGTVQDITERKQAENALRASEARVQSIFRAAPTGIGTTVNRVLQQVNQRLCEMTGYTAAELIGQNSRILYSSAEDYERVGQEKYRQIKISGTGTIETRWRRKDGRMIDVLLSSTPLTSDDLAQGITFTALDITERIAAERARLSLERQVLQSQKLESLGVMAGGIAHDFNNLLMSILGNADLALLDLSPHAPARDSITAITTAAVRAAGLAKQMLAYSGKGKFVIEPINLNEFVEEMAHLLEVSISKKATLKFNFGQGLPLFEGDATQIRQVIMNLITNASDAIGDGSGTIALTTGSMDCTREYFTAAAHHLRSTDEDILPEGEYIYLEVSDTGLGMDEETQTKIFDPFFTTKFTGRGLGLAAVLGIIRGHQGAIRVYSEVGRGTTIKVLFPTSTTGSTHPKRQAAEWTDNWQGTGLVLLVDDDESVSRVTKQMYKLMGFEVITAEDGRQAVEVFRAYAEELNLVQLDLTMPQMNGEEAFRALRAIRPDIRVLLSSGYNEQEATANFAGKGLAGFVQKPYSYRELREAVRRVIEEQE